MAKTAQRTRPARNSNRVEVQTKEYKALITPEMAADWLNHNTHNRTLRNRDVENLKDAILRGEWKYNGDAIRFDVHGTLIDGQHRLWAIVLAETAVESLVIEGLPSDTQFTIDNGAKRKLSDHLKLMGFSNSVALAATINMHWRIQNELVRTARVPTVQQALEIVRHHPELEEATKMANRWHRRLRGSTAGIGALYHEFASRDADAADAFFEGIIEGTALNKESPLYALRRQIETSNLGTIMLMALMIKAWNAYIEGRSLTTLSWRPVGKHAEPFPEIRG